ncbi:MAG: alkaline phosphatase PhoX [Phycisphaerales bacterium JB063]
MTLSRRQFLSQTAAVSAGFAGLHLFANHGRTQAAQMVQQTHARFGALLADPHRVLDLPSGFSYRVISKVGERMDDGFFVPGQHDGMACFEGPDNTAILVRNHEVSGNVARLGPFGWGNEQLDRLQPESVYDYGFGETPSTGGTTTIVYDLRRKEVIRHYLSLAGTEKNCAGGPTPWNTWVTCEENVQRANDQYEKDHGYNFEVPASANPTLTRPVPLKAMGRFMHEAIAVDPESGAVYQTEDRQDGAIYRFLPDHPGELHRGGRLQAMVLRGHPSHDTRNWPQTPDGLVAGGAGPDGFVHNAEDYVAIPPGTVFEVDWIDLDNVEAPDDDLRYRAFAAGAARFARGEGMWYGHESVYFACTTGGQRGKGQIWRYVPSRFETHPDEARFPGRLELFIEPNDEALLQHADNLCIAPWGDVIACEDGGPVNHIVGITPEGGLYKIARNSMNGSEFAGSCFSHDGSTLFVNIQSAGITLAITGPWQNA